MYLESIRTFWLLKGGAFGGALGGKCCITNEKSSQSKLSKWESYSNGKKKKVKYLNILIYCKSIWYWDSDSMDQSSILRWNRTIILEMDYLFFSLISFYL